MDVFRNRQISIKSEPLGHVSDAILDPLRFLFDGMAEDKGFSCGWEKDAAEKPHNRRFARTIRTDQTEDFFGPDFQIQPVDGEQRAVGLGKIVSLNCRHILNSSPQRAQRTQRKNYKFQKTNRKILVTFPDADGFIKSRQSGGNRSPGYL